MLLDLLACQLHNKPKNQQVDEDAGALNASLLICLHVLYSDR